MSRSVGVSCSGGYAFLVVGGTTENFTRFIHNKLTTYIVHVYNYYKLMMHYTCVLYM